MSNKGSSTPDVIEEHKESNTQEEISAHREGNTKGSSAENNGVLESVATEGFAKEIFEHLERGGLSKMILMGEAGTGKTWMAREIIKFAVKAEHDEPIWISLDKKHDKKSLYDTIARQFSLATSTDAREEDGENEKKEKNVKSLKEKMKEKLDAAAKAKKFLLMVLDGQLESEMITEKDQKEEKNIANDDIKNMLGLEDVWCMNYEDKFKVLITRRNCENGDSSEGLRKYALRLLSGDEALKLLSKNIDGEVFCPPGFQDLCMAIKQGTERKFSPAEILMLKGTLKYIANDDSGDWDLTRAMEAATNNLSLFLRYAYDKEGNGMIDCFWHSWHFLRKHGGVHYNELITNWIMEGYLNPTNPIHKAYEEGHHVLMTLIDCHMLKMQEDNVVVVEGATLKMNDYCRRAYTGTADPGLASVLKDYEWEGLEGKTPANVLEGITPADGVLKTLCGDKKEKMISSLLIDGGRLCREVHETFFGDKQNLNLLAIFYPRLKSPEELSISKMEKLLVLMLRGAYLLEDVNHIAKLKALAILEISGSTNLKKIPDDFFRKMSQLRSLDLSGAGIELLPSSFAELTELRRLILRKCSALQQLPKLEKFSQLEVIDLSESTNFEKIQEKSFKSLEKLRLINFSQTKIEKLPIVKTLTNLTILLLKGCNQLSGMRSLKQVSSLKLLDLSGAGNIQEIMYDCFKETNSLRELDLSGTQIRFLPPEIGDLQKLRLKDCALLKNLPELGGHSGLEELELSGCKSLDKLPDLSALQNLKILGLENCISMKILPDLKSLTKLEKLDLRGTELWRKEMEESFSHITRLQILK